MSEWISADESARPSDYQRVLVSIDGDVEPAVYWFGKFVLASTTNEANPTHWMPLPEPPDIDTIEL